MNVSPGTVASFGELWLGNVVTRTATLLTIPAQLTTDRLNAVIMTNPVNGYLATIPNAGLGAGDIWSFTLIGTTVTATRLNTTAMPGTNICQLVKVGTDVLFASQNASGTLGVLGKVDAAGTVTTLVDFSTVTGYAGLVNALAAAGNHAYVGAFDSGTTVNASAIWDVDLGTNAAVKLADLPTSMFNTGGAPFNAGVVNLQIDPNSATTLVVQGVYGDLYRYNLTTRTLIDQRFSGPTTTATSNTNQVNSLQIDPLSGDYLEGTRDGNVDLFVLAHNGEKVYVGIGSGTTTQNSVTGLYYAPFATGVFNAFGTGCPGTGGYTPTSFGLGYPVSNTTTWGIGMASGVGGGLGLLLIGDSNTSWSGIPLPLNLAPMLPGTCNLRVSILITAVAALNGTAGTAGAGSGVVPMPLPAGTGGVVAYCQWLAFSNLLALDAVSDARRLVVQ